MNQETKRATAPSMEEVAQAVNRYEQRCGERFAPRAVLFDMDGVLFNSMPNHATSWVQTAQTFHLDMTPEEAYMHEGRTGADTINILMQRRYGRPATETEIEQIYAEKCRLFNACPTAGKMEGADMVLARVKAAGRTICVVTGSGQQSLLERLQTGYPGYFAPERIVSSKDVKQGKPNPEPYLRALEKTGLKPHEAIVVENAPLGVTAGVAAGILTIAVNTGPLPDSALTDLGADLLFPSMTLLAGGIDAILSRGA
ncbi:MAG: HAD-IA family hydrolase [Alloprevotella sp.]|nr:HAD-IA family hydrolase [Alloprevotella sp.]